MTIVVIGCALLVVGVVAVLARAVPQRLATNDVLLTDVLGGSTGRVTLCQGAERVPAGTGAVRASLSATGSRGPELTVGAKDGDRAIAHGTLRAGWHGENATIPLRPVQRTARTARVCVTIGAAAEVLLRGAQSISDGPPPATSSGEPLAGRVRFDYLAPRPRSWLAQAGAVVERMGFGHATGGSSVALLAGLLALGAIAVAAVQLARGER